MVSQDGRSLVCRTRSPEAHPPVCDQPGRSPGDTLRQATPALSGRREAPRALRRPTHDASPIAVRLSFDLAVAVQPVHICVELPELESELGYRGFEGEVEGVGGFS
jgi:hypothetical protein